MRYCKTLLSVCCLAVFCVSQVSFAGDISWTGCGITKKAFMTEIAKAYEAKYSQKINISGGGATKGIRSAAAGTSDMGGTCRHRLVDSSGKINPAEEVAHNSGSMNTMAKELDGYVDDLYLLVGASGNRATPERVAFAPLGPAAMIPFDEKGDDFPTTMRIRYI